SRLGHGHRLVQVRLKFLHVTVSLSDNVVHRWIELTIRMHLVADVAARALGYVRGEFRVKLRRQFQSTEVCPEILVADSQAIDRDTEAAGVANDGREIMVAIMGSVSEERLVIRVINKRGAFGEAVRTLILRTQQTTGTRFLHHVVDAL